MHYQVLPSTDNAMLNPSLFQHFFWDVNCIRHTVNFCGIRWIMTDKLNDRDYVDDLSLLHRIYNHWSSDPYIPDRILDIPAAFVKLNNKSVEQAENLNCMNFKLNGFMSRNLANLENRSLKKIQWFFWVYRIWNDDLRQKANSESNERDIRRY